MTINRGIISFTLRMMPGKTDGVTARGFVESEPF